jgi:DNA-binding transcriptional regulator YhcF (GntR family)
MQETSQELTHAVRMHLEALNEEELRGLAEAHDIDISGREVREDILETIAIHPGIVSILGLEEEPGMEEPSPEPEEPHPEDEAHEEHAEEPHPEEPKPSKKSSTPKPDDGTFAGLKDHLKAALRTTVDLSGPSQYLSETVSKFRAKGFDGAILTARDAVHQMEGRAKEYIDTSWALAIASAQQIWETSKKSSKPGQKVKKVLKEASDLFKEGNTLENTSLLEKLTNVTLSLYEKEMGKAKEHVARQEKALENIEAMGGDIARARAMVDKAGTALEENHRFEYLSIIEGADELVHQAREIRIEEIREAVDSVEAVIEEARSIGADVEEASELLDQVREAVEASEFVQAHDLVSQAERVSLESQKAHMERVADLRERQLTQVKELIGQIKPLIDRARAEGFQANEAIEDLKAALEYVKTNDYVNALLRAKRAYRAVKSFQSEVEASKLADTLQDHEEILPDPPEPEMSDPESDEPGEPMPEVVDVEAPAPKGQVACPRCGSISVEVGSRRKAQCQSCGKKFRAR